MTIEEQILQQKILSIAYEDMASLSLTDQTMFAMVRRSGLGASDAAAVIGASPWTTVDDIIAEKKSIGITDKELEIGNKESVRKGRDLEALILQKFEKQMGIATFKPAPMYRMIDAPQLTINFDGITMMGEQLIPVEAKFASTYGNKYWDRSKCIKTLFEGQPKVCGGSDIKEHVEQEAILYGIPSYYYPQVQQQMMGLNAPFAYVAVLFDKGWDFGIYKIFQDTYTQSQIILESKKVWHKIKPS